MCFPCNSFCVFHATSCQGKFTAFFSLFFLFFSVFLRLFYTLRGEIGPDRYPLSGRTILILSMKETLLVLHEMEKKLKFVKKFLENTVSHIDKQKKSARIGIHSEWKFLKKN